MMREESLKMKIKALIVDDNMVNRAIHQKLLDNLGIETEMVANGKQAVDLYSAGKIFDLILMDMEMPVMNGLEATKKLREMGIRSRIAGVSTSSSERERQEFIEAGLDYYEEKPLTKAKLVSILNNFELN
ncbi:two-component response regulator ARR22-like [Carica papaya]|uniref:two-component response regulator ARR22-like n=1 Tax=Carica papaya TaxID=3649 RepID=UPI000B8CB4A2|nr:two-component response regulator ARR22-like [Carica papaya]